MGRLKKSIAALALAGAAALTALPVQGLETGAKATVVAVREMDALPGCWSPLSQQTAENAFILSLTTAKLYTVAAETGQIVPLLAGALPQDVTLEYAGSEAYGVPADAARGYAFQIELNPAACWEDGAPVTADQLVTSLQKLLESGSDLLPDFANAQGYFQGAARRTGDVVSLAEAGFSSIAEAREAGLSEFYLDTDGFWGLSGGWRLLSDRTRFRDYAMPAGMDEQYVSAAYLYQNYLSEGAAYDYFQSEFIGVPAEAGALSLEDVGILKTGDRQITLILAQPTTASALALELEEVYLLREDSEDYGTSAVAYSSYGPYRIVSADTEQILLEPNPNWWGSPAAEYEQVICRPAD